MVQKGSYKHYAAYAALTIRICSQTTLKFVAYLLAVRLKFLAGLETDRLA
jgi:hypothetical protein